MFGRRRRERELADARAEAERWYERLGGQIMNLHAGDDPATRQALVDAGERYNAAGSQLERAASVAQFGLARESALEGLAYIRAARVAMDLDPGPDLPPLAGQRRAGHIVADREVDVQGQRLKASPRPGAATPYYHPGGVVAGRPVPGGWYSEPWWRTALVAGAWGVGSVLLFDALFSPGFGAVGWDSGFEHGYDQGFEAGADWADQHDGGGYDGGGDPGGYDPGGDGGGDGAGYDGGYDSGFGDLGGGDFGGGDFGGFSTDF
jgi:hypothetical protein